MVDACTQAIKVIIGQVAATCAPVLIWGELGVGQDLVARMIHAASWRQAHPFIKIPCALIPQERVESELFGHEKGAVPGASRRKLGKVEFAHRGTLFLDEVSALPKALQAKLFQVLKEGECSRVGGLERIRVDVRVIAAIQEGWGAPMSGDAFCRPDLVEIRIPPLRERRDEIPALAALFLARFNERYHRTATFSPELLALFTEYAWPGNLRELEEIVRRLVVSGYPGEIHEEIYARLPLTARVETSY